MIDWLARQSFPRVARLAAVWVLGLPAVAVAVLYLVVRYLAWLQSLVAYTVDVRWPGVAAVVLLPPVALLIAWWTARHSS